MEVVIYHNAGFFSCCSVRLDRIVYCINVHNIIPQVDSSRSFNWYKNENENKDITFDYFEDYNKININIRYPINYNHNCQYNKFSELDYNHINPVVKKYFSPSQNIISIIKKMEIDYNIDYNICVLFYRGNDKATEMTLPTYEDYLNYANLILKENPNIRFLIQSDETEFIDFMMSRFPNSFIFTNHIRHITKTNTTVDILYREKNNEFSKYYLAITIIMSKCKYVICGSGNCSIWIMLYRGNNTNVFQIIK